DRTGSGKHARAKALRECRRLACGAVTVLAATVESGVAWWFERVPTKVSARSRLVLSLGGMVVLRRTPGRLATNTGRLATNTCVGCASANGGMLTNGTRACLYGGVRVR